MEIQLPFNFIAFMLFLYSIFLLFKRWKISATLKKHQRLPPTPWKLPLIGNLHHLVGALPHRSLKKLAEKYGPIVHLKLGEVSVIVVSSAELAKEVLKVQDPACADRPQTIVSKIMLYDSTDMGFSPYNEYWRQMRKICVLELLSAKNVRSFNSIRQDEASRLIKSIQSSCGEPINLTEKIFSFTSSITCRAAFGKVIRDRDMLLSLLKKAVPMTGGFGLEDLFPSFKLLHVISWNKHKLLAMRRKLDVILDAIVDEHRANLATTDNGNGDFGGEDIVDVLLRIKESGDQDIAITIDNIKAIIFDMFSAGTETSSTTIDWAMAELMRNPSVMAKAQTEIREALKGKKTLDDNDIRTLKYLKFVIKETLRLHAPVPLLPRACKTECEVAGYTVPLKAKVSVNVWAIGRDPEYWPDEPDSFKPERFESNPIEFTGNDFEFIPFGAGRRICPGINYGLANVELCLAQLLYHFDWKLPNGMNPNDLDMAETKGLAVSRKNSLLLVPTSDNPPIDA